MINRIISIALIGAITYLFGPILLEGIGVYIGKTGGYVADIAAENKNVNLCQRIFIMPWHVFSPSTEEQRRWCIHEYAELTGDPMVCKALLPSSYGLSCIGTALDHDPCSLKMNRSVGGGGIVASLEECVNGPREIRDNACCIVSRVRFLNNENDCTQIHDEQKYLDQCYDELAFKTLDKANCEGIENQARKIGCKMRVTAVQENPSICPSCIQAVDNLDKIQ